MIDSILDGLSLILSGEKASREKSEEDDRQRRDLARRRQLLKLRREREEKRLAYMQDLMDAEQEATYIRNWLASVQEPDASSEYGRMLAWAKDKLHNLEAVTDAAVVCAKLRKAELFPEADDLHDPLGDPPEGGTLIGDWIVGTMMTEFADSTTPEQMARHFDWSPRRVKALASAPGSDRLIPEAWEQLLAGCVERP
ncbi:hypothetical protein [Phyllobacterium zundukense]|uniref:Uncharacterized protein n=1 Tax=Phyllobacterium zundukense TaxID=1867719 RepID=A0A2N9VQC1_9HYPH|nr:hypothetical protein [Phyllobacterium zundukense]ATU90705.1 hypothetical protein BLM14_02865 [Phyllobacterium zundukense]PIO41689.1 hypothetical protein B5P45_27455 [Phyllobacterium zundukense]